MVCPNWIDWGAAWGAGGCSGSGTGAATACRAHTGSTRGVVDGVSTNTECRGASRRGIHQRQCIAFNGKGSGVLPCARAVLSEGTIGIELKFRLGNKANEQPGEWGRLVRWSRVGWRLGHAAVDCEDLYDRVFDVRDTGRGQRRFGKLERHCGLVFRGLINAVAWSAFND